MNIGLLFLVIALGLAAMYLARRALTTYLHWRGRRLVTCPETRDYAVVEVDAARVARQSVAGQIRLHLRSCSRWGERGPCDESCLSEIVETGDDALVRAFVERFYVGKTCAICHKSIVAVNRPKQIAAALSSDGRTVDWDTLPPQQLPRFFSEHLPVCWDCYKAVKPLL